MKHSSKPSFPSGPPSRKKRKRQESSSSSSDDENPETGRRESSTASSSTTASKQLFGDENSRSSSAVSYKETLSNDRNLKGPKDFFNMFAEDDLKTLQKCRRESYISDDDEDLMEYSELINPIADTLKDEAFSEYDKSADAPLLKDGGMLNNHKQTNQLMEIIKSLRFDPDKATCSTMRLNLSHLIDNRGNILYFYNSQNVQVRPFPDPASENLTIYQMIKSVYILIVDEAYMGTPRERTLVRIIDEYGNKTVNGNLSLNFNYEELEYSSESESENIYGYYQRKKTQKKRARLQLQINDNTKDPKTLKKKINRTYNTNDERSKWSKGIDLNRKLREPYCYYVKFVLPRRKPEKLPKSEYNRIRGFRPRTMSCISCEQYEPTIERVRSGHNQRRRRSTSPMRPTAVERFCTTLLTDFIIPDSELDMQTAYLDTRQFREGKYDELLTIYWFDLFLKRLKRSMRQKENLTPPTLLMETDAPPIIKLDDCKAKLVARKNRPAKVPQWHHDNIGKIMKALFPNRVEYPTQWDMDTLTGTLKREVQRVIDIILQRDLYNRNVFETILRFKLNGFDTKDRDLGKAIKAAIQHIHDEGRIPYPFFDDALKFLPKGSAPRKPVHILPCTEDAAQYLMQMIPRIIAILEQDNVNLLIGEKRPTKQTRQPRAIVDDQFTFTNIDLSVSLDVTDTSLNLSLATDQTIDTYPRRRGRGRGRGGGRGCLRGRGRGQGRGQGLAYVDSRVIENNFFDVSNSSIAVDTTNTNGFESSFSPEFAPSAQQFQKTTAIIDKSVNETIEWFPELSNKSQNQLEDDEMEIDTNFGKNEAQSRKRKRCSNGTIILDECDISAADLDSEIIFPKKSSKKKKKAENSHRKQSSSSGHNSSEVFLKTCVQKKLKSNESNFQFFTSNTVEDEGISASVASVADETIELQTTQEKVTSTDFHFQKSSSNHMVSKTFDEKVIEFCQSNIISSINSIRQISPRVVEDVAHSTMDKFIGNNQDSESVETSVGLNAVGTFVNFEELETIISLPVEMNEESAADDQIQIQLKKFHEIFGESECSEMIDTQQSVVNNGIQDKNVGDAEEMIMKKDSTLLLEVENSQMQNKQPEDNELEDGEIVDSDDDDDEIIIIDEPIPVTKEDMERIQAKARAIMAKKATAKFAKSVKVVQDDKIQKGVGNSTPNEASSISVSTNKQGFSLESSMLYLNSPRKPSPVLMDLPFFLYSKCTLNKVYSRDERMPHETRPVSLETILSLSEIEPINEIQHNFKVQLGTVTALPILGKLTLGQIFKDGEKIIVFCGNIGSKGKICQAVAAANSVSVYQLEEQFWVTTAIFRRKIMVRNDLASDMPLDIVDIFSVGGKTNQSDDKPYLVFKLHLGCLVKKFGEENIYGYFTCVGDRYLMAFKIADAKRWLLRWKTCLSQIEFFMDRKKIKKMTFGIYEKIFSSKIVENFSILPKNREFDWTLLLTKEKFDMTSHFNVSEIPSSNADILKANDDDSDVIPNEQENLSTDVADSETDHMDKTETIRQTDFLTGMKETNSVDIEKLDSNANESDNVHDVAVFETDQSHDNDETNDESVVITSDMTHHQNLDDKKEQFENAVFGSEKQSEVDVCSETLQLVDENEPEPTVGKEALMEKNEIEMQQVAKTEVNAIATPENVQGLVEIEHSKADDNVLCEDAGFIANSENQRDDFDNLKEKCRNNLENNESQNRQNAAETDLVQLLNDSLANVPIEISQNMDLSMEPNNGSNANKTKPTEPEQEKRITDEQPGQWRNLNAVDISDDEGLSVERPRIRLTLTTPLKSSSKHPSFLDDDSDEETAINEKLPEKKKMQLPSPIRDRRRRRSRSIDDSRLRRRYHRDEHRYSRNKRRRSSIERRAERTISRSRSPRCSQSSESVRNYRRSRSPRRSETPDSPKNYRRSRSPRRRSRDHHESRRTSYHRQSSSRRSVSPRSSEPRKRRSRSPEKKQAKHRPDWIHLQRSSSDRSKTKDNFDLQIYSNQKERIRQALETRLQKSTNQSPITKFSNNNQIEKNTNNIFNFNFQLSTLPSEANMIPMETSMLDDSLQAANIHDNSNNSSCLKSTSITTSNLLTTVESVPNTFDTISSKTDSIPNVVQNPKILENVQQQVIKNSEILTTSAEIVDLPDSAPQLFTTRTRPDDEFPIISPNIELFTTEDSVLESSLDDDEFKTESPRSSSPQLGDNVRMPPENEHTAKHLHSTTAEKSGEHGVSTKSAFSLPVAENSNDLNKSPHSESSNSGFFSHEIINSNKRHFSLSKLGNVQSLIEIQVLNESSDNPSNNETSESNEISATENVVESTTTNENANEKPSEVISGNNAQGSSKSTMSDNCAKGQMQLFAIGDELATQDPARVVIDDKVDSTLTPIASSELHNQPENTTNLGDNICPNNTVVVETKLDKNEFPEKTPGPSKSNDDEQQKDETTKKDKLSNDSPSRKVKKKTISKTMKNKLDSIRNRKSDDDKHNGSASAGLHHAFSVGILFI